MLIGVTAAAVHEGTVGYDFQQAFLPAARAVLHGRDPYVGATARAVHAGTAFVYPPVAAFLFTPFAALSPIAADLLVTALCLVCAFLTLAVLSVRDWRCYGLVVVWAPVFFGTRRRDQHAPCARCRGGLAVAPHAVAVGHSDRPRRRAEAVSLAARALALRGAILADGNIRPHLDARLPRRPLGGDRFAGFATYPHLLSELSSVEAAQSYTIAAAALKLGTSWSVGQTIGLAAALGCGAAMVVAGRRGCERAALTFAIGLALVASPIVWMHYFALLLVVVALYVPRLALVWWLPVGLFVFPITPGAATGWMVAAALVAVAAITALAATSARRGAGRPQTVTGSWANVMTPDRRDA